MRDNLKKLQKVLKLAAMAGMLALGVSRSAYAQSAPVPPASPSQAQAPSYSGGIRFPNAEFIGVKSTFTALSSVSKQLIAGQGLLYGICPFGGTLGQYSMAFDTNVNGSQYTVDSVSYFITPNIYTSKDTTSAAGLGSVCGDGCWCPARPIQFLNGLVGVQSHAGHKTLYYYRLLGSSDTNP